ncbi:UDP-N-acetylmuramate dehydrogenase [Vibrio sp. Of7-15]|uniref:UDP-N-acetylmuramate dehydrogenase n=1 Tax=Vibrio sp. Of7-15 TaxID=2724879 RepID=UPI001EF213E0|nr:UDP-N-acetylmuramate dehydrogenase [Vibrio sp. Of7-15]MCG7500180.1 UDP-N-acetylmuramate dehydrogenase [Vibrio sp. Of7-15]
MKIQPSCSLKAFHTFAIDVDAKRIISAETCQDLIDIYQSPDWQQEPKLILGKGSNVLFCENYDGVVILNQITGKTVTESGEYYRLHIGAGEDWPSLVRWSLEQGISGLENLAMIPGCAGSAPIQNIGAYGVELKDICDYVDVLDLETLTERRLTKIECQFGYRDSVFKKALHNRVVITAIGLKLAKSWSPQLSYGSLSSFERQTVTSQQVYDAVCNIRSSKLPDPTKLGNAGSFFKNPIVSTEYYEQLQLHFPDLSGHKVESGYKLAAGWLIDRAGLKGHQIGGAQVHKQQALVIVNLGNASARDIVNLAQYVKEQVMIKYGVSLEHEVRFMAKNEETNLDRLLK